MTMLAVFVGLAVPMVFLGWRGWVESRRSWADCAFCGKRGEKAAMVDSKGYGYFCTEEEADAYWWDMQW